MINHLILYIFIRVKSRGFWDTGKKYFTELT